MKLINMRRLATALIWIAWGIPLIGGCRAQTTDASRSNPQPSAAATEKATVASLASDRSSAASNANSLVISSAAAPAPAHSVKLSWKASVPASKAAHDAIIGYIVYRSSKSHDRNAIPINATQVAETTYVDLQVEPGKIYYYVTRAVSARGVVSAPSNEVRAEVPR